MSIHIKKLKEVMPDFTTIWWRVARMKINLDPKINPEKDDIVIAVDSTGIKVTNRGEWILDKWKKKRRIRKGFIKIHVAVDTKTKKIVSMSVTKEDVHDGKMLKELVDDVSKNYDIKKVLADGGYDSKDNFRQLDEMKVIPAIKVRKNSSVKNNAKCIPRNRYQNSTYQNIRLGFKMDYPNNWMKISEISLNNNYSNVLFVTPENQFPNLKSLFFVTVEKFALCKQNASNIASKSCTQTAMKMQNTRNIQEVKDLKRNPYVIDYSTMNTTLSGVPSKQITFKTSALGGFKN